MTSTYDIRAAITEYGDSEFVENIVYGDWELPKEERTSSVQLEGLGVAELVDSETGREGGGENIWVVFKLNDVFYRLDGYYSSYEGSEWGDGNIEVVVPREKTIIVYDKV